MRRSETEWFLYDTDHDGAFDLALFQPPTGATEAFKLTNGQVQRAPELDRGRAVRLALLKDAKLKRLARVYFNPEVIEP